MPELAPPTQSIRDDAGWQRFLALLAPDDRAAATAYEALRRRLVDVFRWRGLAGADDLADEALERAVGRVASGEEIRNVVGYVCGVANKLALEAARREQRVAPLDDGEAAGATDEPRGDRIESLERCLERLPPLTRRMLLQYYAEGQARIEQRKLLADELGIGLNALRIRVHRLRSTLETCVDGGERPARRARGTTRPPSEAA